MSEKLSVTIITLNEERNIGRCIEAAWQVADEIIVVDSFSTDKTKEICLSKGAKFFENEFEGHIQQKNFAITKASYTNILGIDADEIVSGRLATSINGVKANWKHDAYSLYRLSQYCGQFIYHGDWYPDKKIRLFKKSAGIWAGINPHDSFFPSKGKSIGKLNGNLEHYTFNSVGEHLKQARKFSEIGSKEILKSSQRVYFYHLILHPAWRFLRSYLLRFGFLDGLRGFTISSIIALETYLKYLQVYWPVVKHPFHDYAVLHTISINYWRGGEQQVAYLVDQLQQQGIYNHLVVSRGSELAKYCKENGLSYTPLYFWNGFNLIAAWRLKKLCQRMQIDVVHMHCSPSHTLAVFSNLLGNKAKLILSRRVIFPIRQNTLSLQKFNYPAIERIICVSKAIAEVLKKDIKRKDIFDVVYDGVDIEKITTFKKTNSIRTEFNLNGKKIIGIIAALSPEKDHSTFLEAAKIVHDQNDNTHFMIVGSGDEESNIRNLIKSNNLENAVSLTGFRKDVPDLLHEFDVFVLTSVEEGLGSAIIEAFANNVPVVATKVGGIPELVIHEKTGLLAPPQQPHEIAEQINRLLQDYNLRDQIVNQAAIHLENNFKIDNTANKTSEIYREVIFKNHI
jgi:glycosyltransferase involved in cell wall biosynthesis